MGRHSALAVVAALLLLLVLAAPPAAASTTSGVSVNSAGRQANSYSYEPSLSADGRYVAFRSYASNLVPGDTNNAKGVFVRDCWQDQRLTWVGASGYTADRVDPDTGDPGSTTFTLNVLYTDPTDNAPNRARWLIQREDCGATWRFWRSIALTGVRRHRDRGDLLGPDDATQPRVPVAPRLPGWRGEPSGQPSGLVPAGPADQLEAVGLLVGGPALRGGRCEYGLGPGSATFKFRVQYSDSTCDAPAACRVFIRRPWKNHPS